MLNRSQVKKPPLPSKIAKMKWVPGAVCRLCGQEIKATQFSKDKYESEYEHKWCVHISCQKQLTGALDRNTR